MTEAASESLLRVVRVLVDGFSIETRSYLPDGSYVDWVVSPLGGERFKLTGTPVEVWGDAGSVGTASYAGDGLAYECAREELLATLQTHLGPDPLVQGLPAALHTPKDPRVRFAHCLGSFTLDLPEGNGVQAALLWPFMVLLFVCLLGFAAIPLFDGWRHGNALFGLVGVGALALFGRLLIPFGAEALVGCARMTVEGSYGTIVRGRLWWRTENKFRWADVQAIEVVVTRVNKYGNSTRAQFVLHDGSRVDYATMMIRGPFVDAVKVLQSLLATRRNGAARFTEASSLMRRF